MSSTTEKLAECKSITTLALVAVQRRGQRVFDVAGLAPTWHEQLTHHGAAVQTQRDEKADPAVAGKWPDECGDLPGPPSTSGV